MGRVLIPFCFEVRREEESEDWVRRQKGKNGSDRCVRMGNGGEGWEDKAGGDPLTAGPQRSAGRTSTLGRSMYVRSLSALCSPSSECQPIPVSLDSFSREEFGLEAQTLL